MPLSKQNLEPVVRLLLALSQRHDQIYQLASRLSTGAAWRSPDGALVVDLSPTERERLEDFIRTYLEDAEVILATLRQQLGPRK